MEIIVLEKTKNRLMIKIEGEGHTLSNALKEELYNDKKVVAAGYYIKYPQISRPVFTIETSGKDPKKALIDAASRLKKKNKEFLKEFLKEAK